MTTVQLITTDGIVTVDKELIDNVFILSSSSLNVPYTTDTIETLIKLLRKEIQLNQLNISQLAMIRRLVINVNYTELKLDIEELLATLEIPAQFQVKVDLKPLWNFIFIIPVCILVYALATR